MDKLLEIKDLSVRLLTAYGVARGVRGVSLEIGEGEIVGIVGESGCGKTLTAKSVLGLHNPERAEVGGSREMGIHARHPPAPLAYGFGEVCGLLRRGTVAVHDGRYCEA